MQIKKKHVKNRPPSCLSTSVACRRFDSFVSFGTTFLEQNPPVGTNHLNPLPKRQFVAVDDFSGFPGDAICELLPWRVFFWLPNSVTPGKKTVGATKVPFRSEKPLNLTIDPGGNKETSTWKSNLQFLKAQLLPPQRYLRDDAALPGPGCEKTSKRSKQKNMRRSFIQGEFIICVVFTSLTFFEIAFFS